MAINYSVMTLCNLIDIETSYFNGKLASLRYFVQVMIFQGSEVAFHYVLTAAMMGTWLL